jgi:hypothetical protein
MSDPKKLALWTVFTAAMGVLAAYVFTVWMRNLSAALGV